MKLATIATAAGLIATVIGIGTVIGFSKPWPDREQVDNNAAAIIAHDKEIKEVGGAFQNFVIEQRRFQLETRLFQLRRRLWQLEDRRLCAGPAREECRWLAVEIRRLEQQIKR